MDTGNQTKINNEAYNNMFKQVFIFLSACKFTVYSNYDKLLQKIINTFKYQIDKTLFKYVIIIVNEK